MIHVNPQENPPNTTQCSPYQKEKKKRKKEKKNDTHHALHTHHAPPSTSCTSLTLPLRIHILLLLHILLHSPRRKPHLRKRAPPRPPRRRTALPPIRRPRTRLPSARRSALANEIPSGPCSPARRALLLAALRTVVLVCARVVQAEIACARLTAEALHKRKKEKMVH